MKFYMPLKPIKWGFKIHCMVYSETNYLYNLFFEPSKIQNKNITFDNSYNYTQNIILYFVQELKPYNHRVSFDSWYSSIELSQILSKMGIQNVTIYKKMQKYS